MDWKRASEAEQAALKRIVALLLALAELADHAGSRSRAVRGFVLWILFPAETAARNLVTGGPAPVSLRPAGDGPADAMRLARNFRDLADELDRQATLAFAVYDGDSGQNDAARLGVRQALRGVLNVTNVLAFPTSARDTPRPGDLPDTS